MFGVLRRWLGRLAGWFRGVRSTTAAAVAQAAGFGSVHRRDGWTVAELEGDLGPDRCRQLRAALTPWVRSADGGVVVNLHGVRTMDSTGLATLIACGRDLPTPTAKLRVCCPTARVRALIEITDLARVIEVFLTEDEALRVA